MPEKARLLEKLKAAHFNMPDFIYVSTSDFREERFGPLQAFLENHREIEYITSPDGEIMVVQAKDISRVEILETMESKITVRLDGIRRIRK